MIKLWCFNFGPLNYFLTVIFKCNGIVINDIKLHGSDVTPLWGNSQKNPELKPLTLQYSYSDIGE